MESIYSGLMGFISILSVDFMESIYISLIT